MPGVTNLAEVRAVKEGAKRAGRKRRSGGEEPPAGGGPALGELLDPKDPMATARHILASRFTTEGTRILHYWRDEFRLWNGSHYRIASDLDVARVVSGILERSRCRDRQGEPARFKPSVRNIADVVTLLKHVAPLSDDADAPFWLPAPEGVVDEQLPPAREVLNSANGLLHLREGLLDNATPRFFAMMASPVRWTPDAPEPKRWMRFLGELWPGDLQSRATLQEWMGYALSADTSRQKIALIVGPPRSGKSTIGRVLTALMGDGSVCGPSLASLADRFGLEPMIGKSLAIIPEARIGGRVDQQQIGSTLLKISGEDPVTADRKHTKAWSGRLRMKLMLLSNELPSLSDASGALASRLLVLRLTRSFEDAEDLQLESDLEAELPAILAWAAEGYARLAARGRFKQPESSADAIAAFRDLGSEVKSFVRDYCELGAELAVPKCDLVQAYRVWRRLMGAEARVTEERFGRDIRAACPTVASQLAARRPAPGAALRRNSAPRRRTGGAERHGDGRRTKIPAAGIAMRAGGLRKQDSVISSKEIVKHASSK